MDEANLTQYLLPETNVSNISLLPLAEPVDHEKFNSVVVPQVCLSHRTRSFRTPRPTRRGSARPSMPKPRNESRRGKSKLHLSGAKTLW